MWNNDLDSLLKIQEIDIFPNESDITPPPNLKINDEKNSLPLIHESHKRKYLSAQLVSLKPQSQSSIPHAESLEDEFFYVLSGEVELWLNGELFKMKAGTCAGFPSGKGHIHSVMNRSPKEVYLIVFGEKSKVDNRYIYPINPELKIEHLDHWWHDWPEHKLHSTPGDIQKLISKTGRENYQAKNSKQCPLIVDTTVEHPRSQFSYPNDPNHETFGQGLRLSTLIGLKNLGIWHEILPSGKRSSRPHDHSGEEEFFFVLKGNPLLWINGFVKKLQPGSAVFLPPGQGLAHVLINEESRDAELLVAGQSEELCPIDYIFYPLHPLRNEEIRKLGTLWDPYTPATPMGSHPACAQTSR